MWVCRCGLLGSNLSNHCLYYSITSAWPDRFTCFNRSFIPDGDEYCWIKREILFPELFGFVFGKKFPLSNHSKSRCGYLALLQSPRECLRYKLEPHVYGIKINPHLRPDVTWCCCLTCGLASEHLHHLCAINCFGILVKYMDSFSEKSSKMHEICT